MSTSPFNHSRLNEGACLNLPDDELVPGDVVQASTAAESVDAIVPGCSRAFVELRDRDWLEHDSVGLGFARLCRLGDGSPVR